MPSVTNSAGSVVSGDANVHLHPKTQEEFDGLLSLFNITEFTEHQAGAVGWTVGTKEVKDAHGTLWLVIHEPGLREISG